jgi:hypothetical protein
MHSASVSQARQEVVAGSQMGLVAAAQPAWVVGSHPAQAPLEVQVSGGGQAADPEVQGSHSNVAGLQIGVVPEHPDASAGSHPTH